MSIILSIFDFNYNCEFSNETNVKSLIIGAVFGALLTLIINLIMYVLNVKRDNRRQENKIKAELIQGSEKLIVMAKHIELNALIAEKYNRLWQLNPSNNLNKEYATTFQNMSNEKSYEFDIVNTEFQRNANEYIFLKKIKIKLEDLIAPLNRFNFRRRTVFLHLKTEKEITDLYIVEYSATCKYIDEHPILLKMKTFIDSLK